MRIILLVLLLSVSSLASCTFESSSPTFDAETAVSADGGATPTPASSTASTRGVRLDQILQPYEERAMSSGSSWDSYTLRCWTPPPLRGGDWPAPVDRERVVGAGDVVECVPMTDPPADTSSVWLIVLDDAGMSTSWYEATDGSGAPPISYDRPSGLLCREYMALPAFAASMVNVGEPPWNDDAIAYQFVLAYWFLEGRPARMDADGNGVPCELLFDPSVVAAVWGGDF
jgi:hypothetical protein